MSAYGAPPAGAMFLGAALAWMVFIGIILLGVRLLMGAATSVVNGGRKLGNALHPPPPPPVVVVKEFLKSTSEAPAPAADRTMLPGMTFGKKSIAEKMVKSVASQHPELEPALKETRSGWGIEVNDIEE